MISATVLVIFFVPLFFVRVTRYFTKHNTREERAAMAKESQHD